MKTFQFIDLSTYPRISVGVWLLGYLCSDKCHNISASVDDDVTGGWRSVSRVRCLWTGCGRRQQNQRNSFVRFGSWNAIVNSTKELDAYSMTSTCRSYAAPTRATSSRRSMASVASTPRPAHVTTSSLGHGLRTSMGLPSKVVT